MVAFRAAGTPARASTTGTSPQTTATGSMTINAGDTILVCWCSFGSQDAGVSDAITALTVGGVSLTHATGMKEIGNGGIDQDGFTDAYYILNPDSAIGTGAKTVSVTFGGWAGSVLFEVTVVPICYTGAVNSSTPLGTGVLNHFAAGPTSMTATVTGMLTGDLAVGMGVNGTAAPGVTTGTSEATAANSTQFGCDNYQIAHNSGVGSINIVWSTNASDESAFSAVRIIAATATGKAIVAMPPRPRNTLWRL